MADSVVKLRIDSKEYDANIKRAGQALTDYFNKVREGGGTLMHLDEGVLEAVQAMGQLGTMSGNTKGALRELTVATTDMTAAYRALTDEEKASPLGAAMAKSIAEMTERAGNMKDAMSDVSAAITNAASDTRGFDQAAQGIQLMTSGFQTAVGAAKLLGIEMGNEEQVLATLASAMSITNGLQTAQNLLQKQSALMMGVQSAQAAIATAAQSALAAATGSATLAQKAFNVVANMNPYVALATAIAAVCTALYAFSSASAKAKKEEEELAKAAEEAAKKADEQRTTFVNASAEAMNTASRISSLQVAYKNANTEMEKTSILKQAQTEFKKLGLECKGLNDAQNLLVRDGDKVIEMIRLQGEAAALSALRMEAFKASYKRIIENQEAERGIGNADYTYAALVAGGGGEVQDIDKRLLQMQGRIQNLKGSLPMGGGGGRNGGKSTSDTDKVADPMALNSQKITDLTNEYVTASETRRQAIEKEIATLQQRNAEMQKLKDMAQGKAFDGGNAVPEVTVKGSKMPSITKQFADSAMNFDSINTYIEGVKGMLRDADLGSELYNNLTEKMRDATTVSTLLQKMMDMGLQGADLEEASRILKEKLLSPEGIDQEAVQAFLDKLNEQIEEAGGVGLTLNADTGAVEDKEGKEQDKSFENFTKGLNTVASGLSSVTSGMKSLGIEIPKEIDSAINVMNAVGQIISGVQAIISLTQTPSQVANTTAIGLNTLAIHALIFALNTNTTASLLPFANGGIVPAFARGGLVGKAAAGMLIPGTSYSGDNLRMPIIGGRGMIGVNSGELILNESSQDNLAASIRAAESLVGMIGAESSYLNRSEQGIMADSIPQDSGGTPMQPYVSGEMVFLAMNNYLRRSGKGEIVVSRR